MSERIGTVKDFLVLKYKGRSKITVEGYVGYFVVEKDGNMKFEALQFPLTLSSFVTCKLDDPFKIFQSELSKSILKVTQRSPDFKIMNRDFLKYIKTRLSSDPSFGAKLLTSNKLNDEDVMKSMVVNFFEDWVEQLKLEMSVEELDYSEFSRQVSTLDIPKDARSVLSRDDLKDMSEAYPIIDPIKGKSITSFDVGEQIYFTVLNFSSDESKSKIVEAFPDSFDKSGVNTRPLTGMLISKELVENFRNEFMLVKISCAGVPFKSLIGTNVNIMSPAVKVPKINLSLNSNESHHNYQKYDKYDKIDDIEREKIKFVDFLIATMLVGGIVMAVMIIIYFFYLK